MIWEVTLDNDGTWSGTTPNRRIPQSVTQPRLVDNDYLTRKAFARAIMLKDPEAELAPDPSADAQLIGDLLLRLRDEGFNQ